MEKKKSVKISLSAFFLFLAIIIIIVMAFILLYLYIKKINSNKEIADLEANATSNSKSVENSTITLKTGDYTVNEVKEDECGISNEECGVKLEENNEFQIYMGFGVWHSGKYEIKNNTLICKSTLLKWDGGAGRGKRTTDVIFTFDIVNENKLELSNIDINDTDNEKLVYKDGLTMGMTYSIK